MDNVQNAELKENSLALAEEIVKILLNIGRFYCIIMTAIYLYPR